MLKYGTPRLLHEYFGVSIKVVFSLKMLTYLWGECHLTVDRRERFQHAIWRMNRERIFNLPGEWRVQLTR